MINHVHRVLPLAVLLVAAILLQGCESTGQNRVQNAIESNAERLVQARQASLTASTTAARAEAARDRGRDDLADRLSRQAIEEYRVALAFSTDMPEVWNNLGIQLMRIDDYLAASEAFTFAMQMSPTDPRPCENLGVVYDRTGWAEESLKYFDMALERSKNYLPALRGSIKAAHLLGEANENRLAQVRRALMIETDPKMREFFEREQVRISGRLDRESQRRPRR
jgi:Tfp pilus assembly protein PilF